MRVFLFSTKSAYLFMYLPHEVLLELRSELWKRGLNYSHVVEWRIVRM
jgi:hypothetical protein